MGNITKRESKTTAKLPLSEMQKEFDKEFNSDYEEDILYSETKEGKKREKEERKLSDNNIIESVSNDIIDATVKHFRKTYISNCNDDWGYFWNKSELDEFIRRFKPNPKSVFTVKWKYCKEKGDAYGYYKVYTINKTSGGRSKEYRDVDDGVVIG